MGSIPADAVVGVAGAGVMGRGIAQVAAAAGHRVLLYDSRPGAVEEAIDAIAAALRSRVAKGRLPESRRRRILSRLIACHDLSALAPSALVVEAVAEDLEVKRRLLAELESLAAADAVLATNTSSLALGDIAEGLADPSRLAGMHFFNPAPAMALVEVVSGKDTDPAVADKVFATAAAWGKCPVRAAASPGFIVNRVARPFYGEALRLLEDGVADAATIDGILRDGGGFPMGPFALMDLIGNDVNHAVTCSIHQAFGGNPRYRPSPLQKSLVEAGRLGRKSGGGFFDYGQDAANPPPSAAPPGPRPATVVIEGGLGPAHGLAALAEQSDLAVERKEGGGVLLVDGVALKLTDGRSAKDRARAEDLADLVHFDLALDFGATGRMAIAGGRPGAVRAATGFFQALGKEVSVIRDTPGMIVMATVAMLANEAADAVAAGVATAADVDTAMVRGVNYPLGPLHWADRVGAERLVRALDTLAAGAHGGRYQTSPLLRQMAATGGKFF